MKNNKTNKKGILVFLILLILVLAAIAAFVIYSLKNYTRNNTWIDLEIEVYAGSQGTSGESIVKHEVLTELMAGVIAAGVPCRVIREITDEDKFEDMEE